MYLQEIKKCAIGAKTRDFAVLKGHEFLYAQYWHPRFQSRTAIGYDVMEKWQYGKPYEQ